MFIVEAFFFKSSACSARVPRRQNRRRNRSKTRSTESRLKGKLVFTKGRVLCIHYWTWDQGKRSLFTVEGCSPKINRAISSMVKYMGKMGPGKSVHYEEVFTNQGCSL